MKILRTIISLFLILIISGGIGYLIWMFYIMPSTDANMQNMGTDTIQEKTDTDTTQQKIDTDTTQQQANNNTSSDKTIMNTSGVKNRDKLKQASDTIKQALDLITLDPYLNGTVSSSGNSANTTTTVPNNLNIYPSGGGSINIYTSDQNNSPTNNDKGDITQKNTNTNYIYDQSKFQQLNSGIYTLAQGIMDMNSLSEDLLTQETTLESNPPSYETYVVRYNQTLQNKIRLNNSITMLNQASTLINVNPYASPDGYEVNKDAIEQLHQGVYKLAQGVSLLSSLNDDFTIQLADTSAKAQNLANSSNQIQEMNMESGSIFGTINTTTIIYIVLIIMILGLIGGILGAIFSGFNKRNIGNRDKPRD